MRKISLFVTLLSVSLLGLQAQSLDDVLAKHYKACGQSKMAKIATVKATGTMTFTAMGGAESPVSIMQAQPNKFRIEMELMGSKMIQTSNGEEGWTYAPGMGLTEPQKLSAIELDQISSQTPFGSPLADYQSKGLKLSLEGSEDGKYMIKMITAEDITSTVYISQDTYLIHSISTIQDLQGTEAEIILRLKDYQSIKGAKISHYMETSMMGQAASVMKLKSVVFNEKLDPALFEKPVVQ